MAGGNVYRQEGADGYVIRWRDSQGRRRGRLIKTTSIKAAREALAAEKAKVEKARILGQPLPSEETFADWADEFLKMQERKIAPHVVKGKISRAEFVRQKGIVQSKLKDHFGKMKLAAVRKADVIKFIHERTGQVSDATVIKEVNVLKRMFHLAMDLDKIATNLEARLRFVLHPARPLRQGTGAVVTAGRWSGRVTGHAARRNALHYRA